MASEGGGKIKSKRGHSSSKPYERRKSLLGRITDSIKEVLRPSWLAADDTHSSATEDRPVVSSVTEEEEEEFVSPVQSPSQLPGHLGLGLRTGEASQQDIHHADTSRSTGENSIQWLQRPQLSSAWENRSQMTRTATWGNSTTSFDRLQFSRSFYAQRLNENKLAENAVETTSRGLGGVALTATTSTSSSSSLSSTVGLRRRGLAEVDVGSPAAAPKSEGEEIRQRTDGMQTAAASSVLESTAEENPSKRQRLWSPEALQKRQSQQPAAQRPAFKISVFSAPHLNESLHESSFYSGKTAYGGASAYRRTSLNSCLPYQNSLPIRKSVTAKPLNNSGNAVLSSSATQILKTLERLSDTKRFRLNETDTDSLLSFTPTSYRKPSRPLQTSLPSRSLELPVRGPPVHHRLSPAVASIAKNRQIISMPTQRTQPSSSSAAQSAEEEEADEDGDDVEGKDEDVQQQRSSVQQRSRFAEPSAMKSSGKMKHQKSYDTRGRNRRPSREEDEVVEIPNLRTDFTLPIGSMPTLNFGLPSSTASPLTALSVSSTSKVESGMSVSKATSASASATSNLSPPKLQFTFSSPIQKSAPGTSPPSSSPATDFQFSSPLKVSDSVSANPQSSSGTSSISFASTVHNPASSWSSTEAKPKGPSAGDSRTSPASVRQVTSAMNFGFGSASSSTISTSSFGGAWKPASQLKSGSVMDILGQSPQPSSSPGFKAAGELKQGSVMDVLGGKSGRKAETVTSSSGLKPAAELKQGSVMDILGGKSSAASPSGSDSLMAKFAPRPGSWECSSCMVCNTPDASKCVACTAPKPAQQVAASSKPSVSSSDSLFARFAPAAGSWECESCMVQNKSEADKCVACQARKPETAAPKPTSTSGGDNLFAKFAAPAGSWDCETCLLQNKAESTKCVACEAPKPGAVSAAPKPSSTSGGDSLFAKFAAPAGSWDCEGCLLQNKAEDTKCVACETPKPGTAASSANSTSPDSLMTKFRRPAGSWDCDVCMVQNTGAHTKCVACESPRPDSISTGTVPPRAPAVNVAPGGGLTFNLPSTSAAPSPFLAACSTSAQSTTGFKFGTPTSSSSALPASGGFQFRSSSGPKGLPAAGGLKFGQQDTSNSNSASSTLPPSGFQFGAKDSSAVSVTTESEPKTVSSSSGSSGFKFGAQSVSSTGGFVFGSSVSAVLAATTTTTSTTTTPVTSSGFAAGSTTSVAGFQFGAVAQTSSQSADTKSDTNKLTSGESVTRTESLTFTPVFGAGKPSNSFALGVAPSLVTGSVSSLTSGGFQFQGPTSSKESSPSPFATGFTSPSSVPASDSAKTDSGSAGSKPPSLPGGFTFSVPAKSSLDAAPKPGLFASGEVDSAKKNGISSAAPSSSSSQGFAFGAASSGSNLPTNLFSSVPQLSSGGFISAPASKLPVNGEVGPQAPFSFGQQPVATGSSAPAGFSFGVKDNSITHNSLTQAKSFTFGTEASTTNKPFTEKRHLENDIGPTDAKKRPDLTGSSTSGSEGFKFVNPAPAAGSNLFKFTPSSQGPQDKAASMSAFGGQASGFGASTQGGFNLPLQSNAASSTGVPQAASVFGAGAGTGLFSFGLTTGSQSNAAAASPFGSEGAAPTQGFNFSGATQPSFNFGTNSTNSSTPVFQFGSATGEPAPAQPAGSGFFVFGQTASSTDSSATPSAFPATNPASFGAAPAQSNFTGTGDGHRKFKRAVRRGVRK